MLFRLGACVLFIAVIFLFAACGNDTKIPYEGAYYPSQTNPQRYLEQAERLEGKKPSLLSLGADKIELGKSCGYAFDEVLDHEKVDILDELRGDWVDPSGSFTEINEHGVTKYAKQGYVIDHYVGYFGEAKFIYNSKNVADFDTLKKPTEIYTTIRVGTPLTNIRKFSGYRPITVSMAGKKGDCHTYLVKASEEGNDHYLYVVTGNNHASHSGDSIAEFAKSRTKTVKYRLKE